MVSTESRDPATAGSSFSSPFADGPEAVLSPDGGPPSGIGWWHRFRPSRRGELWRRPDFLKLWAAATVSGFGSHVTLLALPLTAVLTLDATPFQMGLLTAIGSLPYLLIGLFAGVWVDRRRRRPLMIAADVGRALLLLSVPIAAFTGYLRIEGLYVVALLVGALSVLEEVAASSFLPSLVGREQLVAGNAKLQASQSVAQAAGPGLAGVLVGVLTAPLAIAFDAFSFLASAVLLRRIRTPEASPPSRADGHNVWAEIGEGLRAVVRQPVLRPLTGCGMMSSLFGYVFLSVYVLYMARDLDLAPPLIGLILSLGGVGAFVGALLAEPVARRIGVGPAIIGAQFLFGVLGLFVPFAVVVRPIAVPMIAAAEFLQWLAYVTYLVSAVSLRQALAPDHLRGRINATSKFLIAGSVPLGGLLGGVLGEVIGLGPTLVVGVFGMMLGVVWVFFSPLRALHDFPAAANEMA